MGRLGEGCLTGISIFAQNFLAAFAKPVLYAGAVEKAQISIYNEDCLQALKRFNDKHFDLAIVDPPYGIGRSGQTETFTKNPKSRNNAA